ncbi:antifreeze protein [Phlegmacium glaucopus]|nr:antifreeze protein [Phlegmacium glaucopus]
MRSNINFAALALGLLAIANSAFAVGPAPVNLRTAGNYAILAESGVSTVPSSSITGDIGVSPISSTGLTGFSPTLDPSGTFSTSSQVTGKLFAASYKSPTPSQLTTAISDMLTAFNDANGRVNPNFVNLSSGNIGGLTLAPGLYKWSSSVNAASGFTISGGATDTWIFQIAGTFGLANGVQTTLLGGAKASNIVWVVSGAVTLGVGSHLEGVVLGKKSITLQTGSSVHGRLLSQANVALQSATVTVP